jgi:hypothetical protein
VKRYSRDEPFEHHDECYDNDSGECICEQLDERDAERRADDILDDLEWDRRHG